MTRWSSPMSSPQGTTSWPSPPSRSTIYKAYPQLQAADPDYIRLSGTSMATAVTSGAIAQLLEANRTAYPGNQPLTANTVKAILQYTAVGIHDDLGLEYDPLRKGAGALNARGAIDFAASVDTSAPVGAPWLTSSPFPWTTIGGESLTWNQGVIWGSAVIWGSTATFNETAWANAVIWGSTNVTWGNAVIWGSNLVWTDSQSWGSAVIWGSDAIGYTDGNAVIWGSTGGLTASSIAWKDVGGSSGSAATTVSPREQCALDAYSRHCGCATRSPRRHVDGRQRRRGIAQGFD